MNNHIWTDDDVQALVEATKRVIDNGLVSEGEYPETYGRILDALRPFQPDPDARLVLKARIILDGDAPGFRDEWADPRIRAIIAAVREHDRERRS